MSTIAEEEPAAGPSTLHLPEVTSQQQTCALLVCAIQHLFYAKGQVYEPIATLQSRRARENVSEAQQKSRFEASGIMRSKGKGISLQKRRQTRKTDELLLAIQRLQQSIILAIQQLQQSNQLTDELALLFRFGQSRLSCHLQFCITLRGLNYLKPKESALQDAKIRRQKMSTMERKLIRFLLGLSAEDEAFIKVLNKPLHTSRAHVFLMAPATFSCRGWIRGKRLKQEDLEGTPQESTSASDRQDPIGCEMDGRRDIKEEGSTSVPSLDLQDRDDATTNDSVKDDIDSRRILRMQQRAMQRAAKDLSDIGDQTSKKAIRRKKLPLSASFTIDCNPKSGDSIRPNVDIQDAHWFACKVSLKGVT